jgi:DNA-binding IclR family transcriptional regulator
MNRKQKDEYQIQSVSRALDLLEQYQGETCELKPIELSTRLNASKNYVVRLLDTLESRGFVMKNHDTGGYHLGHAPLRLGQAWLKSERLAQEGRKVLEDVSGQCGETVYLAVFRNMGGMSVDCIESTFPVRVDSELYTSLPLHCTAPGKIMLAHASQNRRISCLERRPLKKYTEKTIASPGELMEHLDAIRERGIAVDCDEYEPGLCGVAAPVRNHASRVIGVVGLVGHSFRLAPDRLRGEFAQLMVNAARKTSQRLGYQEPGSVVSAYS